jgi:hypothetical protein
LQPTRPPIVVHIQLVDIYEETNPRIFFPFMAINICYPAALSNDSIPYRRASAALVRVFPSQGFPPPAGARDASAMAASERLHQIVTEKINLVIVHHLPPLCLEIGSIWGLRLFPSDLMMNNNRRTCPWRSCSIGSSAAKEVS